MRRFMLPLLAASSLALTGGAASSADKFAAIAYSRTTGVNNVAYNHPSRTAAEHTVLDICRRQASDCTAPVWVQNGCVALAVGVANGFGTGWGATRAAAERDAINVCRNSVKGCAIRRVACTTSESAAEYSSLGAQSLR